MRPANHVVLLRDLLRSIDKQNPPLYLFAVLIVGSFCKSINQALQKRGTKSFAVTGATRSTSPDHRLEPKNLQWH